jgi:hypothetical protein
MHQCRLILSMALWLIVSTAVHIGAQPRYTVTDLGAFQPQAIAGAYVVGSEGGLPVRLNIDTGDKLFLGHAGNGGAAHAVIPTGEAVGTVKVPGSQGGLTDAATFWNAQGQFAVLPGPLPSQATGLNDSGVIAGTTSCAWKT